MWPVPHRTTGTKAQCLLEERETMDSYFVNLNVRVYICGENSQTADLPSPPICEFPHSFMIKKHSHFIRKLWGGFGSDPSAICASLLYSHKYKDKAQNLHRNRDGKTCRRCRRVCAIFSTASGALVVGGVRDICSSIDGWIDPGDRFECSMEYNQSVSGSLW